MTAAYNPRCNGLVERQNRTTQRAMVASLLEKQANWYYILPSLQMSFRMHTYSSTGLTAHEMMFGRKPAQLPILLHSEEIKDPCPIQTELLESAEKLPKHVCSNAADSIKKAQAKQAMAFACRHESPVPPGRFVSRLQDVSDQIAVIHEAHISSGHSGIAKTKAIVGKRFYWPGMVKDIRRFVATCNRCRRNLRHSNTMG